MTEIEHIRSELEKTEQKNDKEIEKFLRLSIFLDKDARKMEKKFLKKDFSKLKDLKKKIKEIKKNLPSNKAKWESQLLLEKLSEESRQQLSQDVQKAKEILAEIDEIENKVNMQIEHFKKLSMPIALYEANISITIIFFILGVFSWFIGYGIKQWLPDYFWIITVSIIGIICLFLGWKIFYLRYYCRKIEATGQIYIIVFSLKLTNAFLLTLIPYCCLCFCLNANQYFYIIPTLIISAVKTGASIFDFCSASKFFDSIENIITLGISILFAVVLTISIVDNWIVLLIAKMLLMVISLLLTILMLKKCLLDNVKLDGLIPVYYFVCLLLVTIVMTCLTIYIFTWNKEPNAEQALFSSVMGIYAAVLGGALTLGGVAWTIKKADKDRKEDDKKKYRPIVNFFGAGASEISGKFLINSDFEGLPPNPFINKVDKAITYKIYNLICKNTDFSPLYFCGVVLNKTPFNFSSKKYVDKNDYFGFGFNTLLYLDDEIKYIALIVQDLLGNEYKLPVKFEASEDKEKTIKITDVGFACDIDTEECDETF